MPCMNAFPRYYSLVGIDGVGVCGIDITHQI